MQEGQPHSLKDPGHLTHHTRSLLQSRETSRGRHPSPHFRGENTEPGPAASQSCVWGWLTVQETHGADERAASGGPSPATLPQWLPGPPFSTGTGQGLRPERQMTPPPAHPSAQLTCIHQKPAWAPHPLAGPAPRGHSLHTARPRGKLPVYGSRPSLDREFLRGWDSAQGGGTCTCRVPE